MENRLSIGVVIALIGLIVAGVVGYLTHIGTLKAQIADVNGQIVARSEFDRLQEWMRDLEREQNGLPSDVIDRLGKQLPWLLGDSESPVRRALLAVVAEQFAARKESNGEPREDFDLPTKITLKVGEKLPVVTSNVPERTTWTSTDNNVAKVDARGIVTAVGVGAAIVTAEKLDAFVRNVLISVDPQKHELAIKAMCISGSQEHFKGHWNVKVMRGTIVAYNVTITREGGRELRGEDQHAADYAGRPLGDVATKDPRSFPVYTAEDLTSDESLQVVVSTDHIEFQDNDGKTHQHTETAWLKPDGQKKELTITLTGELAVSFTLTWKPLM